MGYARGVRGTWLAVGGFTAVACSQPDRPVVIADLGTSSGIHEMAADGSRVFFRLDRGVSWVDREGAPEISGVSVPRGVECAGPVPSIAFTADALVWGWIGHGDDATCGRGSAVTTIERVPFSGAPAQTIATPGAIVDALVVDATHVYWAERDEDRVRRAPLTGGSPELVLEGVDARSLAAGDAIYVLDAGERAIHRFDPATGTSTILVDGVRPLSSPLLVDEESIYWLDGDDIAAADLETGAERTVAATEAGVGAVAVDGDRLVFTAGLGLWEVDTRGDAEPVAISRYGGCCVALDEDYLYLDDIDTIVRFDKDADMPLDPPPGDPRALHPPFL
jgi:hypothetical protein